MCLVLKINASAQVVLTHRDIPAIGTKIIYTKIQDSTSLNNFIFDKTGTDNFWDFSKLPSNYSDTLLISGRDSSPFIQEFNETEWVVSPENSNFFKFYSYYKVNTSGLYSLGYTGNLWPCPLYQPLKYKKPYRFIKLPAYYPMNWQDTAYLQTQNYLNSLNDTTFCDQFTFSYKEIVASGQIKLQFGNFEAFLLKSNSTYFDTSRIKEQNGEWRNEVNVMGGGNCTYFWFCKNSTSPVAQVILNCSTGIPEYIHYQMNNYANLKSLDIEDISSLKTNIYPNPATEKLFIENNLAKNSVYTITNLLGQEMDKGVLKSEIDISHLLNGVYLLKIVSTNNQTQVFKFIKQ